MTATVEEFLKVETLLEEIGNYRGKIQALHKMGQEYIHSWDDQTVVLDKPGHSVTCLMVRHHLIYLHNTTGPAAGPHYYLFDCRIHQRDWFTVLGITPDEQLIHLLKWGPQP